MRSMFFRQKSNSDVQRPKLHISSHFLMCSSVTWSSWHCWRCWPWIFIPQHVTWLAAIQNTYVIVYASFSQRMKVTSRTNASMVIYLCCWHLKTSISSIWFLNVMCSSNAMSNACNFPLPGCITSLLHSVQNVLPHRAVEEDGFLSHESNPWLKRARQTAKMIKRKVKEWSWAICLWFSLISAGCICIQFELLIRPLQTGLSLYEFVTCNGCLFPTLGAVHHKDLRGTINRSKGHSEKTRHLFFSTWPKLASKAKPLSH